VQRRRVVLAIAAAAFVLAVAGAGATGSAKPTNTSRYLTMRDGVRIAVDLWLSNARSGRIPALIQATRYWRAWGFTDPKRPDINLQTAEVMTRAGYALVLVDVRGSGASFGTWRSPWSRAEIADLGEVVDWIVRQPWSNGRVGAYGSSYPGNTAERLASLGRRAVKAVIPISDDFDPYLGNAFPGGIFSDWFVHHWNALNQALDRNDPCAWADLLGATCSQVKQVVAGVKPVDGDAGGKLLGAAVKQHGRNLDVYAVGRRVVFRDEHYGSTSIDAWSPFTYLPRLARAGVAVQAWVGWMDAGTVDGALSRFMGAHSPQTVLIGPWSHALDFDSDPYHPPNAPLRPSLAEQSRSYFRFLDPYLKGKRRPPATRQIRYYTLGEGTWHTTNTWPPRGVTTQRWFFGPNGSLGRERPTTTDGADEYAVNFAATTGSHNRWHTQAGNVDVIYSGRAREDKKLLTYTSALLERDLEITGHPVVTLDVTSTARDGAFIVYLEDVAPSGRVIYITEGELRALHRKISKRTPPYRAFGPYHSFRRADGEPLVPGGLAELRFALQPTSVLIRKNHRIRIAIAGADKGTFARIPATGNPVITVARNAAHPSRIDLPVRRS
jgi:uncharacterized protein